MSTGLPCPNPICTHVFAAAKVAGATALTCPRCGTVLPVRSPLPKPAGQGPAPRPAPAASPRLATPPPMAAPVPMAQPVATPPPVPMATPLGHPDPDSTLVFAPPPDDGSSFSRRRRRHRGLATKIIVLLLLAGGVAAGIYFGLPYLRQFAGQSDGGGLTGKEHTSREFNYSFVIPRQPWAVDEQVKSTAKANLMGLRRTDPNVWMALAAKDYQSRSPRDGEVNDEAIRRLNNTFTKVEWEQKDDAALGAQPARRLIFQAEANNVLVSGECRILVYKGIVYWFTVWTPTADVDDGSAEFDDLFKRFSLDKNREGWTEKRPPIKVYRNKQAGYQLKDTEALWEKQPNPKDFDPDADLALRGNDRVESKDVDKIGWVYVLVLKPEPDLKAAVEAAKKHFEDQQKREYPRTTLQTIADKDGPVDRAAQIGDTPGHLVKLDVTNGENRRRFVILGVVRQAENVLVVQCECDYKRRSLWEGDFNQLLKTFSVKVGN